LGNCYFTPAQDPGAGKAAENSAGEAALPVYDIKEHCKNVAAMAGGSSQMEVFCRETEDEAKRDIARLAAPARIMKHCDGVARFSGGSYQMLQFCIQQEMEADKKLN